jgi:hypothetical protein
MSPDEPILSPSTADEVLLKTPHITGANGSGIGCLSELKCQLYAQSRALHFTRFGMEIPNVLLKECGLQNKSLYHLKNGEYGNSNPGIAKCLSDLVFMVARDESQNNLSFIGLNPPLYGEYDAIIPITKRGL